ncbi:ribosomal protein S12 methylthiotransferase [Acetitomaculum ruminis DSM 5522]|uniref:Ribosomal protein uS12 methylthiotransferase RimO n=1 Tax=Acetitomaculum ruminis DSM 5522 TaxID=1120918 RepID=A0A1I0VTG2_9FIRM|nr:30S ribosomal protein S12 methylthiotransferase RimO [Acetitomaculum ruminis]SFA79210.1 ribosomal protein S12 methylthiotransferase [Acetitomaculum ruminis DSM 5522]
MNIFFMSYGCDKNLVDSEKMLGLLSKEGFSLCQSPEDAEVIVVNTCCFIDDAKSESIDGILEAAAYKNGKCKILAAVGCLAQRYREEIRKEIPEVDVCLGTGSFELIVDAVKDALKGKNVEIFRNPEDEEIDFSSSRILTTGGYYAYLKIAEGCDKHCTYCIIPSIKGKYKSVPMEDILREANDLVKSGVKELILVAQETTLYGTDLYQKKLLPKLLEELNKIEDLEWIRLLYCYPEEITDELIQAIKTLPKVCHYIDMPIQHSEDRILKKMGRRTSRKDLVEVVEKLRKEIPDICIRTTLITGFPGETEEEHKGLMDFIDTLEFDRLGVFAYSREEDTPAAEFKDQVSDEIKERRLDELMSLQQQIAFDNADRCVGEELKVLIEGRLPDENVYVGRTYKDAPDVDGYIFLNNDRELLSGDFVKARVTGSSEYDLTGEIL